MILFLFVNVILFINVVCGTVTESNEDYFDPILYYLLNVNETELSAIYNTENDDLTFGGDPVFTEGVWKCGSCDNATEIKLIYSETNDVDTNIVEEEFMQVQVGLSFEDMRCIIIDSDQECTVARVAGDCAGTTVTLTVTDSHHFIVRVFGE